MFASRHNRYYATLHSKKALLSRRDSESIASMKTDNVLLTVAQIMAEYSVSGPAVRRWIAAELIKPVRREGRGRSGTMYFARGEVAALVYGMCPVCGNGFKRGTIKQRFCGKACRQRSARLHAREL